jgi:YegS/Rv2252/BmrU family lipid kinase
MKERPINRRALLLLNPRARLAQKVRLQTIHYLQKLGLELIEEPASHPKHLSQIIRQYEGQIELVVIGSGDGTISAAVEGLLSTQIPLGILPLGTANNLARSLEIPLSLPQACNIISKGKTRRIDLGCLNGKHFLNVAGLGLSTAINQQVTEELKRRWGVLAYIATALKVACQFRPFEVEICWDGQSIKTKTRQVTVCNGRYYGSGLIVAKDAAIDDQRLDLYSLEMQNWWETLTLLPGLMRGNYVNCCGIRTLQGKKFAFYTSEPCPMDIDGEAIAETPAHFHLIPQALSIFVP